jgi:phage-related protein
MDDNNQNPILLTVFFYKTLSGNEPVREWLLGLEREKRRIIGTDIRTIQYRWPLGMPLVRKMKGGLWEVRSVIVEGISRVLFTIQGNQMILLHGFIKKSQKIPATDLQIAKTRLSELLRRTEM